MRPRPHGLSLYRSRGHLPTRGGRTLAHRWYNRTVSESERHRLFVAIAVPETVARLVADAVEPVRAHAPAARWTDPTSWHLTLSFLGLVPVARREEVTGALAGVAARHQSFELRLTGQAGMFGRRVLWAGLTDDGSLHNLAVDVRTALEPLGFPPDDRPFHPHLTLARARRDTALPKGLDAKYAGPEAGWWVRTLDLMRSHLSPHGARYEHVARWPLNGLS